MRTATTNLGSIWWLHPGKLLLCFLLPLYLLITGLLPLLWPQYIVLRYGTYLDGHLTLLGAACLAVAGGFSLLGGSIEVAGRPPEAAYEIDVRFLKIVGLITVTAYAIWFGPLIMYGQLFVARDELNRIPGVTSFGQLGVPFVICYTYAALQAKQALPRSVHALFYAVLGLTLLRAFVWSERLALIEIGVPLGIAVLAYCTPRNGLQRAGFRLLGLFGPFLAVPALLGFFALTEFFRSWSSEAYQSQNLDLREFMISRLVTYYYTALNNGAGLLAMTEWPAPGLNYLLTPLYKMPFGIGQAFWSAIGPRSSPDADFLLRFADPEFNNMSGIFIIVYDLGVFGALVYFGLFGFFAGLTFRALKSGRPLGILFFAPMYVACLECLRISYLHGPRAFVIVVGVIAAATQLRPRPNAAAITYAARAGQPG